MRRRSIRFRITLVATAAVAAVLVVGSLGLVLLQRSAMTDGLDEALTQRADDITALVSDEIPDTLAAGSREGFAQLVGADGRVLVATPNLAGSPPLPLTAGTGDTIRTVDDLEVDDDTFRVLTRPLADLGVLHVGTTYDVVEEAVAALVGALAATLPVLVLVLAAVVWWLAGRTLRPVEDIRSQVAEMGAGDLTRRVPRPGTDDEIDRLAETMNQMLDRLENAVGRQRRFVADASHELRSPLTRIRTALEVDLADAAETETIESIHQTVLEMQDMLEDLLYLARSDEGAAQIAPRPVDLDDVVIEEARRIQDRGHVAVDLSQVSGAHVTGDRGRLARAIRNLLDNAERHARSQVTLSLRESDGMAVLVVVDDGPGVPPQQAERIFERFGRVDESRSADTGGTGLGLAIAREIAELHGGSLDLRTAGEDGASFELRIPLGA